jgi:hypothetical protein
MVEGTAETDPACGALVLERPHAATLPNAQAEARATRDGLTPATKRTLWPVASSAVLGAAGWYDRVAA